MTRRTIYRIALATSMLSVGNWSAYWWLLPRKMKRCRTVRQAIAQITAKRQMDRLAYQECRRYQATVDMIRNGQVEVIEREFRLPFKVVRYE